MREALGSVLREEGIRGLWRGTVPTMWRVGMGMGVYFFCLNHFKLALVKTHGGGGKGEVREKQNSSRVFLTGFGSRGVAALAVMPLTVVKTRIEAGDRSFGGTYKTLLGIYEHNSVKGLYRGVLPTVLRDAPASGVYLLLYSKFLDAALAVPGIDQAPRAVVNFVSGIAAGAVATVVTNPPDVVRTRMQLQFLAVRPTMSKGAVGGVKGGGNALEVAADIIKRNGVWALFTRGLAPRVIKKSMQAALTWTVYHEVSGFITKRSQISAVQVALDEKKMLAKQTSGL